jgi:Eco57I restriction-modification methylase
MIRGGLFTRYWLQDGIRQTPQYRALQEEQVISFATDLDVWWRKLAGMSAPVEAETESEFIHPVLDRLGWNRLPQQVPGRGRRDIADELLFATAKAKTAAQRLTDKMGRFRHGAVVVENEARDTRLDRAKGQEEAPSHQILRYLNRAERIPGNTVRWGLLTNGRFWRLYSTEVVDRDVRFFEIELPALLGDLPPPVPDGADPQHWARVFLLLFGNAALIPDAQGQTFLADCVAEGRRYEERITERLSETVFDSVFPDLVGALAGNDPGKDVGNPVWRSAVKEAALILLFRFLFILYAEDRGLLPVESERYLDYSFRRLRDDAEAVVEGRLAVRERGTTWWARIRDLFDAIEHGSVDLELPEYNGGLFDDTLHPLLGRVTLYDAMLAKLLESLSRVRVEGMQRIINYRDLSVQQLGAIYERLLERDVVQNGTGVITTANATARHGTGSFFTTQKLVELIVSRAVGPLLEERRVLFQAKNDALRQDTRTTDVRLGELYDLDPADVFTRLRVCDPAMGSGHFLVSLVDYLAVETLAAMAAAVEAVSWAAYRSPLALRIAALRDHLRGESERHGWRVREEHLDDRALLRRIILKRWIYGVDLNPLAVELAKLSLWLHCFTVGAPRSFLDHHLRVGDSLLGERVGDVLAELQDDYKLAPPPIGVQNTLNAAAGMAAVEDLTDSDITEVRASKVAFAGVEAMTSDLRGFLDQYHARRWATTAERSGVAAFFGGAYGDPVGIIAGVVAPRGPSGDATTKSRVRAQASFAAFQVWHARAPALANDHRLLHWQAAFPGVWTEWEDENPPGGFDAVIGNPPYVRQEQIKEIKPALQALYGEVYDGVADLYVYFYDQGLRLLRRGGRLSFVVTNKWIKAGYAAKLRARLGRETWIEAVIDFGHAKKFFPDADVMPCVIVVSRPEIGSEPPPQIPVAVIPRDLVDLSQLDDQIRAATFFIPREKLAGEAWLLEPPNVAALMDKIRRAGMELKDYAGCGPHRGVLTGYNDAFVIDTATRERLIREDSRSDEVIRPYLRGQDIDRWASDWDGQWMIVIASSSNRAWPWTVERDPGRAEAIFAMTYPAIYRHFQPHRARMEARQDQGRFFWELRECTYYEDFLVRKIVYQEIQYHPSYTFDGGGSLVNNKCFFIPSADLWLLAVLNSSVIWWHNWRFLGHAKDEALTPQAYQMELVPIAHCSDITPDTVASINSLRDIQTSTHQVRRLLADWYHASLDIAAIPNVLRDPFILRVDEFVAAIRRARPAKLGTFSAAAIRYIRDEYTRTVLPAARQLGEAARHERALSDLVDQAYGLTPEDVDLMWRTAPPRMPIPAPA